MRNRDTGKRPGAASGAHLVRRSRLRQAAFLVERDETVEPPIQPLDPIEEMAGKLDAGVVLRGEIRGQVLEGSVVHFGDQGLATRD
jgi:hypothetical protein